MRFSRAYLVTSLAFACEPSTSEAPDAAVSLTDASGPDGSAISACPFEERVLAGSYTIENSLDVAALAGYTRITGDLTIVADGLPSIVVPDLCAIDGTLSAQSSGLDELDLPSLRQVGRLWLYDLVTASFDSLEAVSADVVVGLRGPNLNLGALRAIGGSLRIASPQLTHLDGLASLRSIGDDLEFSNNPSLVDSEGLAALADVPGDLTLLGPTPIHGSTGLMNIAHVGGNLELQGTAWPDLSPLAGLLDVGGDLRISGTNTLQSTAGAPALATIGGDLNVSQTTPPIELVLLGLQGIGEPSPVVWPGPASFSRIDLPALLSIDTIDTVCGPSLTEVRLPGLASARRLHFLFCENLTSLELSSLATVTMDLAVWQAGRLPALDLPSLESTGDLVIQENPSLASVSAPALTVVTGSFQVRNNPILPLCQVDAILSGLSAPPASIDTGGNDTTATCP